MSGLRDLSPKDLERLSAYLDRALTPSETAIVEARLRVEPGFRKALEELRQVVVAVRSLEEIRVPRNFTLHQAEVSRRVASGYPALRLATALASAAFVLLSGLRLLSPLGVRLAAAPMAAEPQSEFAMRAADAIGTEEASAAEPEVALPAEVPLATGLPDTLGATAAGEAQAPGTPTAAATTALKTDDCADCPPAPALESGAMEARPTGTPIPDTDLATNEVAQARVAGAAFSWLAAAQWGFGLVAASLLVVTLVVRRRS